MQWESEFLRASSGFHESHNKFLQLPKSQTVCSCFSNFTLALPLFYKIFYLTSSVSTLFTGLVRMLKLSKFITLIMLLRYFDSFRAPSNHHLSISILMLEKCGLKRLTASPSHFKDVILSLSLLFSIAFTDYVVQLNNNAKK